MAKCPRPGCPGEVVDGNCQSCGLAVTPADQEAERLRELAEEQATKLRQAAEASSGTGWFRSVGSSAAASGDSGSASADSGSGAGSDAGGLGGTHRKPDSPPPVPIAARPASPVPSPVQRPEPAPEPRRPRRASRALPWEHVDEAAHGPQEWDRGVSVDSGRTAADQAPQEHQPQEGPAPVGAQPGQLPVRQAFAGAPPVPQGPTGQRWESQLAKWQAAEVSGHVANAQSDEPSRPQPGPVEQAQPSRPVEMPEAAHGQPSRPTEPGWAAEGQPQARPVAQAGQGLPVAVAQAPESAQDPQPDPVPPGQFSQEERHSPVTTVQPEQPLPGQPGPSQPTQSQGGQSQAVQSEPERSQPHPVVPQPWQPQPAPGAPEQSQAEQSQLGQSQAGQAHPGQTQAEQSQAERPQAGHSQAEQLQAGQSQPGQMQAGQSEAELSQPHPGPPLAQELQPDPGTPEQSQPGQSQAGQAEAEQSQPHSGTPQPWQLQPDLGRPEQSQPSRSQDEQSQAGQTQPSQTLAGPSQADDQMQAVQSEPELSQPHPGLPQPSELQPDQGAPGQSQADRSQAGPSQAELSQPSPSQAERSQAGQPQPSPAQAGQSQSEQAEPELSQPRPVLPQPSELQPDPGAPGQSQLGGSQAGQPQAERSQPSQSQNEQAQPGQSQPSQSQAERSQPGQSQNEQAQPEQSHAQQSQAGPWQAEQSQSGQMQAEHRQPGQPQPGQRQDAQPHVAHAQPGQWQSEPIAAGSQAGHRSLGHPHAAQWQAGQSQAGHWQGGQPQAGPWQAGPSQAGHSQAGPPQAGHSQAGQPQAGPPQGTHSQAGPPQGGHPQAGQWQAGHPQAGHPQGGQPQAGPRQAGQSQGGQPRGGHWQAEQSQPGQWQGGQQGGTQGQPWFGQGGPVAFGYGGPPGQGNQGHGPPRWGQNMPNVLPHPPGSRPPAALSEDDPAPTSVLGDTPQTLSIEPPPPGGVEPATSVTTPPEGTHGTGSSSTPTGRRTSSRASGRGRLGAGLVEVPVVPVKDPASAVLTDPAVSESKRFCSNCGAQVGRGTDGKPGTAEGECANCDTPFNFRPRLFRSDLVGGQYEVLGCLAYGGLGWIYLAKDHNVSDRWVVLKGMIDTGDETSMASAVAERRFLAEVEHPNVVRIYNFVEHPDPNTGNLVGYIVMEYVGGQSLRQLALSHHREAGRAEPLPIGQVIAYGLEILPAIGYLHSINMLYCDLKPDNVIQSGEQLKLIDLGAVRQTDDYESPLFFTLGYSAPELASEGATIASDIYTVGRTLAVLSIEFAGYTTRHKYTLPGPEEEPLFALFGSYFRVLKRATHENPALRFTSAEEMADQLTGVLREVMALGTGRPRPGQSSVFAMETRTFGSGMVVGERGIAALARRARGRVHPAAADGRHRRPRGQLARQHHRHRAGRDGGRAGLRAAGLHRGPPAYGPRPDRAG